MNSNNLFRGGAGLWVGLGLLTLSGLAALSTTGMKIAPSYSRVGPQIFPYAAAIVLGALALFFIWQALTNHPDRLIADTEHTDKKALASVAIGFILFIVTLETLGFIVAATLLFTAVARGFGSARIIRDALIGLALAASAFLVFTRLLDLQLPAGLPGGLF